MVRIQNRIIRLCSIFMLIAILLVTNSSENYAIKGKKEKTPMVFQ